MPHRGYKIPGCIARIFLIPLALLLSACSDADHKQDGKILIKYWEKWNGPEADAMRAVVNDYNASQEKVYVDFSTVSQMDRRLMLAIAGGVPPDVAGIYGKSLPVYAENNALMPLDKFAATAGIRRDSI
jgi:ABC-type glycerol-3-phosphate transport system substrate-binding protein